MVVFHCTPLLIVGLINEEFILNLERKAFKKLMRISNFINNDILQKWTKGQQVVNTVKKLCGKIMKKMHPTATVPPHFNPPPPLSKKQLELRKKTNRVPVKTYLLKLGLAIGKDVLIPDHRYCYECKLHNCVVTPSHMSNCKLFHVDFQTFGSIKHNMLRGKRLLPPNTLRWLVGKLEDIHTQLLDAVCKKQIEKVLIRAKGKAQSNLKE